MDPSTQAHIDPSILSHQTGRQGDIPSLGVASTTEIKSSNPFTHANPALASLDPIPSHGSGSGLDPTTSTHPSSLAAGDIKSLDDTRPAQGLTERAVPTGLSYPESSPKPYHGGQQGITEPVSSKASEATNDLSAKVDNAKSTTRDTANTATNKATEMKNNIAANVEPTVQGLRSRVNALGSQAQDATHQVAEHPVVQNVKQSAEEQVGQFREFLGNFPVVKDLEKRTGVDRVWLVVAGVIAYFLLVPLNLFGLALPVTQFLTFVPPSILAMDLLEKQNTTVHDEDTKTVLAYFVILGLIQLLESLAPGVLARRIPQYWTVKLIFLAYLIHPQTKGALKIHNSVLRNLVLKAKQPTKTPPTSKPFNGDSQANSPTFSPRAESSAVPKVNSAAFAPRPVTVDDITSNPQQKFKF